MKRLPDAEFEAMKAIWDLTPPVTAAQVWARLSGDKEWKVQTVITLLSRLAERGFLLSQKNGKERTFAPLISREAYLRFETGNFVRQYHGDSFTSLVSSLYGGKPISDEDAEGLLRWLGERRP